MDVGTAEGVDRLLGVADHEQAGFPRLGLVGIGGDPVDALEDPVLHRVGILELVDQRHRELLADQCARRSPPGLQARAAEQVVEADLGTPLLSISSSCPTSPNACNNRWGARSGRSS